jgi:hypothetical protein
MIIYIKQLNIENTEIVDIATTDMIMLIFYILFYIIFFKVCSFIIS